jgi:hypothetical protein
MRKSALLKGRDQRERGKRTTSTKKTVGPLPVRQSTHSEDGVDLTLIRWMLSLSPAKRLQVLQDNVGAILRLRGEETKLPFHTPHPS